MKLFDFAFVPNYPQPLERLADMARKEPWGRNNRVLKSYFNHMFEQVHEEQRIVESRDGAYCTFNTGLTNSNFESIFAVFTRNEREDAQAWFFRGFGIPGMKGLGELLRDEFEGLPHRLQFGGGAQHYFFPVEAGEPHCNWEAMCLENLRRLPNGLLLDAVGGRLELPQTEGMERDELLEVWEQFRNDVAALPSVLLKLTEACEWAMEQTMDRCIVDYKTAVPQWNARLNEVQLLLPLALTNLREVDAAVAIRPTDDGKWEGVNILTLDMAYNNARLIARPEAGWLVEGTRIGRKPNSGRHTRAQLTT
jgi:hypothetical protein